MEECVEGTCTPSTGIDNATQALWTRVDKQTQATVRRCETIDVGVSTDAGCATPRSAAASRASFCHDAHLATGRTSRPLLFAFFWVLLRRASCELGFEGYDLSNFQGKHACHADVLMGTPSTVAEVSEIVSVFPKVRAVGVGHSWHRELFCAGTNAESVNVLLAGVRSVRPSTTSERSLLAAFQPPAAATAATAVSARVSVDTARLTVRADAGVRLRDLLDYLANYDDQRSGGWRHAAGYTLPAFPWFIDQTVGGAVATATHGSSLRHGSLSSQVTALTIVVANGTVIELSADDENVNLFDAARASMGRLGVVVDVTLSIVPNLPVRKTSLDIEPGDLVYMIEAASEAVVRCEDAFMRNIDVDRGPADVKNQRRKAAWECAMASAEVRRLDEMQLFWFFPLGRVVQVEFNRLNKLPDEIFEGTPFSKAPRRESQSRMPPKLAAMAVMDSGAAGSTDSKVSHAYNASRNPSLDQTGATYKMKPPETAPDPHTLHSLQRVLHRQPMDAPRDTTERLRAMANNNNSKFWAKRWAAATAMNVESGIFDARESYLTMSEEQYDVHDNLGYNQYETCVPLRLAGNCLRELAEAMKDRDTGEAGNLARGFRSQGLIRFVNAESALLAPTNADAAGACLYINIEDFKQFASEENEVNEEFQNSMKILRGETCQGRLHWGKAGWPEPGCFEGPVEYGTSWCDFGCAAQHLDPTEKFASGILSWHGMDFEKCCEPNGGKFLATREGCTCESGNRGVDDATGETCGVRW